MGRWRITFISLVVGWVRVARQGKRFSIADKEAKNIELTEGVGAY
jgi:hypothetical protein